LRGGKKTNMTETSDISKAQTAENQLIAFDPNNSMQEKEIKCQVQKLLQAGLIKESNSSHSTPVTLAFKHDESKMTRLCIDFRKLNALCKVDSEPLPIMDSLLDKFARAKIFSTLDLASGYWHVPIHPKDTEKLAFCTYFGLYEWCRLPFGIKDPDLTCHVFVDASQKSVGAVLKQPGASNVLHPIAHHSRTLRDYGKNHAITELECLAIIDALDKFYCYLHGQKFIIHTDHAALVWLKNVKNLRGRLFRWSLKLSMYDYEIKYLKGSTNIEAYMLSRHPVAHHLQHSSHLLDINEIKTHQKNHNLCGPKYHEIKDVKVIKKKNLHKIVIPFSLRLKLLNQANEQFGHSGVQKMLNLISLQYYWPNITTDVSEFIKHCMVC
ncbi:retrovirus-related Pol polyprotein from transposon 17.6, partial [Trichonephila clavipes]